MSESFESLPVPLHGYFFKIVGMQNLYYLRTKGSMLGVPQLKFFWLFCGVSDPGERFLNSNLSTSLKPNPRIYGMNQDSIWGRLMNKIRGQKSRVTVPLMWLYYEFFSCSFHLSNGPSLSPWLVWLKIGRLMKILIWFLGGAPSNNIS